MLAPLYQYRATIKSLRQGRAVVLDIDLGFGVWMHNIELAVMVCDSFTNHRGLDNWWWSSEATTVLVGTNVLVETIQPEANGFPTLGHLFVEVDGEPVEIEYSVESLLGKFTEIHANEQ